MLGMGDRRPVAVRPVVAPRRVLLAEQHVVRGEPLGAFPAAPLEEDRAQRRLALVERADAQWARLVKLLERVDNVIELTVALVAERAHVRRTLGVWLEAVEVAL